MSFIRSHNYLDVNSILYGHRQRKYLTKTTIQFKLSWNSFIKRYFNSSFICVVVKLKICQLDWLGMPREITNAHFWVYLDEL